jgi:hypothetical protein
MDEYGLGLVLLGYGLAFVIFGYYLRKWEGREMCVDKNVERCEHCVWDGVAYWEGEMPVAQWVSCDVCDWGNE